MKFEINKNLIKVSGSNKSIFLELLKGDCFRVYEQKVKTDLIELAIKKSSLPFKVNEKENSIEYKNFKFFFEETLNFKLYKDGNFVANFEINKPIIKDVNYNELKFDLSKVSYVYGLGDKVSSLDHKGYFYKQWNHDADQHQDELYESLYKSINYLLVYTNKSYFGLFFPSTYPYEVDVAKAELDKVSVRNHYATVDFFIFLGNDVKSITSSYSALVGHPYMVRLKMLGQNQSRWSYENEEQVKKVVEGYRKNNIPLDYIHLDIHYMNEYRDFTINKDRFPDMKKLNKFCKDNHVDLIPINDSGIKQDPNFDVYKFCKEHNLISTINKEEFVGIVWPQESIFPKYYSKEGKEFFAAKAKSFILDNGFSGLWNDMNEPVSFKGELPDEVDFSIKGRKLLHVEEHNVYAEHMIKCFKDIFKDQNIRPYLFSRAGFATTPKYAFAWNGDNYSLWHHLKLSIPQILSMSISGNMFNGVDCGGFGGDSNKQLLIRWIEANFLMPFLRNHSTLNTKAQEPYAYDKELQDIYTKYLNLRYELLPYLYNLVYHMNKDGIPMVRPLFYNYPEDENVLTINDQYMIGDDLMSAPIIDRDQTDRIVYFPKGTWIDYETGETFKGGKKYIVKMPIDKTGLYVRKNSLIPVFDKMTYIEKSEITSIGFKLFGNKGKCEVYEDDGNSLNYQKGEFNIFNVKADINGLVIKCKKNNYKSTFKTVKFIKDGNIETKVFEAKK